LAAALAASTLFKVSLISRAPFPINPRNSQLAKTRTNYLAEQGNKFPYRFIYSRLTTSMDLGLVAKDKPKQTYALGLLS
jgi:hypothetical protein